MKHRTRIAIGTVGIATVFLLLGTGTVQHLPEEALAAPHIRPACELTQEVGEIPLPEPQIDCTANLPTIVEEISSVSDTAADTPCAQSAPEPKPESTEDTVAPQAVNPAAPARQEQQPNESAPAPKESAPQMGDTRMVDGRKQVYFLGFGWIDDNGGGGEGTIVDGDGDINKMVGDM
ncbi:Uncharacterized [Syntrophomonas zehnderi OL-4]|uniref:Uncharacterized n=1 Tax=Syntrophomonas zehnderi OL-4 TaxID=690567 RepID=A0A0E4G9G1_9FIRM|nr:DUF6550 family protein [Syntrophomonas zehnderi]CFX14645.1 Uncharacterized [Syntrophomonas zehnderi OL-4]